jgi:RHS repeat-associated protein
VEYRYANSTRFFHNDHLGTAKAVTDHTGLVLERWDHYPFGEEWASGLAGDRYRYTGHPRDQETGNDYAGARYYTNARGRWLSVDPVLGDVSNPQRLNRYSYVGNDPVNIVDPDGMEWRFARTLHYFWPEAELWIVGEIWTFTRSGPGGAGGTGAFGEGGRGGGPSPLWQEGSSARFQFIAQSSMRSLVRNIRWNDPDCAEIFSTLGVGKEEYLAKLGSVQLVDGTTSQFLIGDLVNEPWARLKGVLGWTVARLFEENYPESPPNTHINAWTPPTGPYIFLYGRGFPDSPLKPYGGVDPATIAHEIFHKFRKYDDGPEEKRMGHPANGSLEQVQRLLSLKVSVRCRVFLLACVLIWLMALTPHTEGTHSYQDPSGDSRVGYRVVLDWREFFGGDDPSQRYDVSVDRWLAPEDVRALICRLVADLPVREEWTRFTVGFFFDVEDPGILLRGGFDGGPREDHRLFQERWIATYVWNEYYAEQKGGGMIELLKDEAGKPLESRLRFVFDHRRCPPSAQEQD